ncbi:MerR family transcriptional regulator [Clostridium sp. KNHs205]|uniref:MerR family transcriptional regulator n=1 Tax=Clostridium sp. KNHs205 TaxID=1449050 RepID=UPI00051BD267|nr:MerR family transcriptional regulator [Clostridium sp. KNHs205]
MYKIGEFSRITMLSIKALRYYDSQGILSPTIRGDNQYRMYDENDYEKAILLRKLKKCGFTITEIKDVFLNCDDTKDLNFFLMEKREFIKDNIKKEKELIKDIEKMLLPVDKEAEYMEYSFEIKNLEPVNVVSVRFKGKYSDMGKYIGSLYKAVKGKADGSPFCLYYDEGYKEKADIELCVPFKGNVTSNEVTVKQLPAVKAVCTQHSGTYETLNEAYKQIIDYAKSKGYEMKAPSREIYVKGPGMIFKGNPNKYITDIVIPIK